MTLGLSIDIGCYVLRYSFLFVACKSLRADIGPLEKKVLWVHIATLIFPMVLCLCMYKLPCSLYHPPPLFFPSPTPTPTPRIHCRNTNMPTSTMQTFSRQQFPASLHLLLKKWFLCMLTHSYPHHPMWKIKVATWNHQADDTFFYCLKSYLVICRNDWISNVVRNIEYSPYYQVLLNNFNMHLFYMT